MTKQLLIVDDEPAITSALSILLQSAGYIVQVEHSGNDAIDRLNREKPDLVLLDIMLPDVDGFAVCHHIRLQSGYTPILMLTARDETWDKVAGLELGADVYMTKPFKPGELLAQVKALLRLADQMQPHLEKEILDHERPLICGPLALYRQQHRVELNNVEIELSPKEFELLQCLMEQPGQVFGRQTLLRQVWGYEYPDESRTVDTHIQRLRTKIEINPTQPQLLQTVRGFGYRLVCGA